eukprot:g3655.t1
MIRGTSKNTGSDAAPSMEYNQAQIPIHENSEKFVREEDLEGVIRKVKRQQENPEQMSTEAPKQMSPTNEGEPRTKNDPIITKPSLRIVEPKEDSQEIINISENTAIRSEYHQDLQEQMETKDTKQVVGVYHEPVTEISQVKKGKTKSITTSASESDFRQSPTFSPWVHKNDAVDTDLMKAESMKGTTSPHDESKDTPVKLDASQVPVTAVKVQPVKDVVTNKGVIMEKQLHSTINGDRGDEDRDNDDDDIREKFNEISSGLQPIPKEEMIFATTTTPTSQESLPLDPISPDLIAKTIEHIPTEQLKEEYIDSHAIIFVDERANASHDDHKDKDRNKTGGAFDHAHHREAQKLANKLKKVVSTLNVLKSMSTTDNNDLEALSEEMNDDNIASGVGLGSNWTRNWEKELEADEDSDVEGQDEDDDFDVGAPQFSNFYRKPKILYSTSNKKDGKTVKKSTSSVEKAKTLWKNENMYSNLADKKARTAFVGSSVSLKNVQNKTYDPFIGFARAPKTILKSSDVTESKEKASSESVSEEDVEEQMNKDEKGDTSIEATAMTKSSNNIFDDEEAAKLISDFESLSKEYGITENKVNPKLVEATTSNIIDSTTYKVSRDLEIANINVPNIENVPEIPPKKTKHIPSHSSSRLNELKHVHDYLPTRQQILRRRKERLKRYDDPNDPLGTPLYSPSLKMQRQWSNDTMEESKALHQDLLERKEADEKYWIEHFLMTDGNQKRGKRPYTAPSDVRTFVETKAEQEQKIITVAPLEKNQTDKKLALNPLVIRSYASHESKELNNTLPSDLIEMTTTEEPPTMKEQNGSDHLMLFASNKRPHTAGSGKLLRRNQTRNHLEDVLRRHHAIEEERTKEAREKLAAERAEQREREMKRRMMEYLEKERIREEEKAARKKIDRERKIRLEEEEANKRIQKQQEMLIQQQKEEEMEMKQREHLESQINREEEREELLSEIKERESKFIFRQKTRAIEREKKIQERQHKQEEKTKQVKMITKLAHEVVSKDDLQVVAHPKPITKHIVQSSRIEHQEKNETENLIKPKKKIGLDGTLRKEVKAGLHIFGQTLVGDEGIDTKEDQNSTKMRKEVWENFATRELSTATRLAYAALYPGLYDAPEVDELFHDYESNATKLNSDMSGLDDINFSVDDNSEIYLPRYDDEYSIGSLGEDEATPFASQYPQELPPRTVDRTQSIVVQLPLVPDAQSTHSVVAKKQVRRISSSPKLFKADVPKLEIKVAGQTLNKEVVSSSGSSSSNKVTQVTVQEVRGYGGNDEFIGKVNPQNNQMTLLDHDERKSNSIGAIVNQEYEKDQDQSGCTTDDKIHSCSTEDVVAATRIQSCFRGKQARLRFATMVRTSRLMSRASFRVRNSIYGGRQSPTTSKVRQTNSFILKRMESTLNASQTHNSHLDQILGDMNMTIVEEEDLAEDLMKMHIEVKPTEDEPVKKEQVEDKVPVLASNLEKDIIHEKKRSNKRPPSKKESLESQQERKKGKAISVKRKKTLKNKDRVKDVSSKKMQQEKKGGSKKRHGRRKTKRMKDHLINNEKTKTAISESKEKVDKRSKQNLIPNRVHHASNTSELVFPMILQRTHADGYFVGANAEEHSENDGYGYVTYYINITEEESSTGEAFYLWTQVKSSSADANSFYISLGESNQGRRGIFHLPLCNDWTWVKYKIPLQLSTGDHDLVIKNRESGTSLRLLWLSQNQDPPGVGTDTSDSYMHRGAGVSRLSLKKKSLVIKKDEMDTCTSADEKSGSETSESQLLAKEPSDQGTEVSVEKLAKVEKMDTSSKNDNHERKSKQKPEPNVKERQESSPVENVVSMKEREMNNIVVEEQKDDDVIDSAGQEKKEHKAILSVDAKVGDASELHEQQLSERKHEELSEHEDQQEVLEHKQQEILVALPNDTHSLANAMYEKTSLKPGEEKKRAREFHRRNFAASRRRRSKLARDIRRFRQKPSIQNENGFEEEPLPANEEDKSLIDINKGSNDSSYVQNKYARGRRAKLFEDISLGKRIDNLVEEKKIFKNAIAHVKEEEWTESDRKKSKMLI